MNKVILMGRLTKEPEIRYSQGAQPLAITKYSLAVNRRFKKEKEPEADFINCTAFGKQAEFAQQYFHKGQLVAVVGRLQVSSWEDTKGNKRWSTDVLVEEQHFAQSKKKGASEELPKSQEQSPEGFYPIEETGEDAELPF